MLVSARRVQAEQFTRHESGIWHYQAFNQPSDLLRFASFQCEIPLAEAYDRVALPATPQGLDSAQP